ncbi:FAD-dependent monooxygenase [Tardiphaga sp.]|uniref:FAD-dependent monooxygenase n=1 Tax=Tardiphaga sp. TaxID=1926292 RepID=UPI0026200A62|nr:FAD-dependent monooxygenase [Tardiphaga sp.]MDB5621064.1 monooxygenase FAD-binding protein [Tardiphaga sp.]
MQHIPVLIVGGSLVGLSASLFLSWRGISNTVVEKHRGSSPHPRAMGFTEMTLEHYRTVGIADRIPQTLPDTRLRRVTVENLASDWTAESEWTPGEAADRSEALSPCSGAAIAQDRLEPILRNACVDLGSDLRLGVEVIGFEQEEDRVQVRLRERDGGLEYEVTADYVIAADGATSAIRESLGIGRSGVGHLRTLRSVLFSCPAADAYLDRGPQQFQIEQADFHAFLTTYGDSRWVLMFDDDRDRSDVELADAVRRALGSEMHFEIITTGRWEMAGRIANCYSEGRIFLTGDSAHQLPPTRGGFGANTGIADAWNLAWKLEHVLTGRASRALLETYDAERRPIGWLRHQQTFSRPDYAAWVGKGFDPDPLFGNDAMEFGQLVRSAAVIGAGPELPMARRPDDWAGQPGTRAPHVWVSGNGETISTLDLFGRDFVLLTASPEWATIGGLEVACVIRVGIDVHFPDDMRFQDAFGVGAAGASLVRPDGIVAWRSRSGADDTAIASMRRVLKGSSD